MNITMNSAIQEAYARGFEHGRDGHPRLDAADVSDIIKKVHAPIPHPNATDAHWAAYRQHSKSIHRQIETAYAIGFENGTKEKPTDEHL